MSLSMVGGKVMFAVGYGGGRRLQFQTAETYNSGTWVRVEGARAVRNGEETGVLRVATPSGETEDLMDTIASVAGPFEMERCRIFFGGTPPDFRRPPGLPSVGPAFLGNLRGLTVSHPGSNSVLNPLYSGRRGLGDDGSDVRSTLHHGVRQSCEKQVGHPFFAISSAYTFKMGKYRVFSREMSHFFWA